MSLRARVLLGVLAALAVAAPAQALPVVGISDQQPGTFGEPAYRQLERPVVRLVTPWNQVLVDPAPLDAWLAGAREAGQEPLVTFEHARGQFCPSADCVGPSPSWYLLAFRKFRARYPWVTTFAPWNEANHASQPTATDPALAAGYFNLLLAECPDCTLVGADLLAGQPGLAGWVDTFRRNVSRQPEIWGLHNYSDVNRFRPLDTDAFLDMVPGDVWLTETGGITYFRTPSGVVTFPFDEWRSAQATHYLFDLVSSREERIKRVYVYQWRKNPSPTDRFDAGLTRPDGSARPALAALRQNLGITAAGDPAGPGEPAVMLEGFSDPAKLPTGNLGAGDDASRVGGPGTLRGRSGRALRTLRVRRGRLVLRVACEGAAAGCPLALRVVTARRVGNRPRRRVAVAHTRTTVNGLESVSVPVRPFAARLAARHGTRRGLLVRAEIRARGRWQALGAPVRLVFG